MAKKPKNIKQKQYCNKFNKNLKMVHIRISKKKEKKRKGNSIIFLGNWQFDQPWDFFGRNDAKAETPVLWTPHVKS